MNIKNRKKAFTLIELIVSTIIIAFIFGLIAANYKEQHSVINNFKEKVQSVSLGQQGYNFINYLFLSRVIKLEKQYKKDLISGIISKDTSTDIYLRNWLELGLNVFYNNGMEVAPNSVNDGSFWVLRKNVLIGGEKKWAFVNITGPEDTDNMPNVNNLNVFIYGEDRTGPFYYIEIKKEDTGVEYDGNKIYKLKFIEHFIYDNGKDNNYTYKFTINPLELK